MATPVIGFVIEAIQKIVSGFIGRLAAMPAKPVVSRWRTLFLLTTMVTAPAISFFATICCMAAPTPGSFGSLANADVAASKATITNNLAGIGKRFMAQRLSCHGTKSMLSEDDDISFQPPGLPLRAPEQVQDI